MYVDSWQSRPKLLVFSISFIYLFIFNTAKGGWGLVMFFLNIYTFTHIKQEFIKKKLYEKTRHLHVIQWDITQHDKCNCVSIITYIITWWRQRQGHEGGVVGAKKKGDIILEECNHHLHCYKLACNVESSLLPCFVSHSGVIPHQAQYKHK